jgi:sortase A
MAPGRGHLLLLVERLLWLFAAAALGMWAYFTQEASTYQSHLKRDFETALKTEQPSTPGETKEETPALSAPPARDVRAPFLGRLEIPRLDMSVMLLEGVDSGTLRHGIGHIPGTAMPGEPGNMGIAGHRDTFFRGLAGIHHADEIILRTLGGEYHYVVDSIRVVDPAAIAELNGEGRPVLTLVTCYPFALVGPASRRLVVHASLEEP